MSGLDQPIVIANSCFHVGHERTFRAAEEQGFFEEEGLDRYVYERGGLVPEKWEHEVLGQIMWERGIDIATAVDVRAAILQRARGEDVYIVGGWRVQLAPRLIAAKGMNRPEQFRGARIPIREKWGLRYHGVARALRTFGLDPERDVEWIERTHTAYGHGEDEGDLLRSGEVTLLPTDGKEGDRLVSEGFPIAFDLERHYRELDVWPPGRVVVATRRTVEERGDELSAFLRGSVRGFWFAQDTKNRGYMFDLETRLRAATFNDTERKVRQLRTREDVPPVGGNFVMDGLVPRQALAGVIDDMVQAGALERPLDLDDVLKDAASIDAFDELQRKSLIDPEVLARWRERRGRRMRTV
jgi:ABC-type nitrate/sulfonate/bicarbonate transport system substrate-binding protein